VRSGWIQPIGQVDDRVVEALKEVLNQQRDLSTGTRGRVIFKAQQLLDERHGAGVVPLPSRATLYRLIAVLAKGTYAFDHARTRRTNANRPHGSYTRTHATRPGEVVQFDTTRMDVLAFYDDHMVGAVELTIALDICTRSILAWRFTPADTKGVDAALLLAQIVSPEFMRPGWRETLQMAHASVPYQRLVSLDERLTLAAARPVVLPRMSSWTAAASLCPRPSPGRAHDWGSRCSPHARTPQLTRRSSNARSRALTRSSASISPVTRVSTCPDEASTLSRRRLGRWPNSRIYSTNGW
jgi:hypothetical protein